MCSDPTFPAVANLYAWHSRTGALERLIPPWEKTTLVSRLGGIAPGRRVGMRMHLGPVPYRWDALHIEDEPGVMFHDIQQKGPFSQLMQTLSSACIVLCFSSARLDPQYNLWIDGIGDTIILHWLTVLILCPLGYFIPFVAILAIPAYVWLLQILFFNDGQVDSSFISAEESVLTA